MGSRPLEAATPAPGRRRPRSTAVRTGRARRAIYPARRAAAGAIVALLLAPIVLLALLALTSRGEVLPRVRVADVPVGGLSAAEARDRVGARAAALAGQPLALSFGDRRWAPLPADLGVAYDVEASVAAAMAHGRETDRLAGLLRAARLARDPATIPLAVAFDRGRFEAYLDRLDAEIGTPPVDAAVSLTGTEVAVTPARDGRGVDRAAARQALAAQIARLQPGSIALAEQPKPAAVGTDQATAVKTTLDRAFAAPLALTLGDESWSISPAELAAAARVSGGDGAQPLSAGLDGAALTALVDRIAAEVDAPTSDARVDDLGTHHRLVPAVRGRTLRRDELARAVQEAFAAGTHAVELPVAAAGPEPAVTTEALLSELGVVETVAAGDSDFAGSDPGRDSNVRLAAERVDGTLVPPGGVFSFNAAVGTLFDSGFVPADATIEGIAGPAEAGGVCQVSTTVFRAALRAGLPMLEWWPHTYRSPFYEQGGWSPGFDASIVQVWQDPAAGSDFRFENPTDGWLLVRAAVADGSVLRVDLRGTDPGYVVTFDDPVWETGEGAPEAAVEVDPTLAPGETVEARPAADGVTVTVVRRVLDAAGNEVATDTFVSPYSPRSALLRVGPDQAEAAAPPA